MTDMRTYKETVKTAVAMERTADANWSWNLQGLTKGEARIGWGYLDWLGEKDSFKVRVEEDETIGTVVVGRMPNGNELYAFVGPEHWNDFITVDAAIAGMIHSMAASAHRTY